VIGVLVGELLGGLLGGADAGDDPFEGLYVLAGVILGSGGLVVGGAIGAGVRTEVWSPVPLH
jgi:hypothetical protein